MLGEKKFQLPLRALGKIIAIIPQSSLFSWEKIEAASDLDRLALVLSVFPDEELMQTLEKHGGRGRDDYPMRAATAGPDPS